MTSSNRKSIYETLGRESVHPFPARMAPGIAVHVLESAGESLRVLDPMMGSGTALALARSKGHYAIGVDIDPLAVLIARVRTTSTEPSLVRQRASQVLARARSRFSCLRARDAYPRQADDETREFLRYWFDEYARRQLTALAGAIGRVRDPATRDVLWCAFSRLIIAKQAGASLAMDLAHSRPHRAFKRAPTKPFRGFLSAVGRVVENCLHRTSDGRGPAARIRRGDARALPLADASIDLVLTSPPYLNAIDYMRCSKFSLVWMGHSIATLRGLRAASVGTEVGNRTASNDQEIGQILKELKLRPPLASRDKAVLAGYIEDMRRALTEVARVLKPGGDAVYVVGENTVRGTYIRNAAVVAAVAELAGLKLLERRVRTLPANRRYLPPPSFRTNGAVAAFDGRIRREVVLRFTKQAA